MLSEFWLIGGMALVTFAIRYGPIALSSRLSLPPRLIRLLRYVPPVVLTAIVVPAVLLPTGLAWTGLNPRWMGAIGAVIVAYWRQDLLLTIVVGMGIFFLAQALLVGR